MTSLVGRVVARSLAVLVAALVAVGVGTGALLHLHEVRATDQALLAAASTHGALGEWEVENVESPVRVAVADPRTVPRAWLAEVLETERPAWHTLGDQRLLLILIEQEGDRERDDLHRVIVASVRRPTVARTVGPFALAYGLAALLVALAAAGAQWRLVRGAVGPLTRAVGEVERATGSAIGTRIEVAGPDEVRALLQAVAALLARRDDAFRAQRRFTAAAAHELRTPVTAILGEVEVTLRRPRSAEESTAALNRVRDEVRRLVDLVEGLLLLARVDAGQAEQGRAREHAGALAEAAARRERASIEAAGGRLRVETAADPEVEVHEALVVAAIANLLRNAAVHAPGAAVTLRTEPARGQVRFVVEDDGPGFTAATPFERRPDGLGLGLPLTREIARRHGGDCAAEARERGAAVVLTLPLAPGPSRA